MKFLFMNYPKMDEAGGGGGGGAPADAAPGETAPDAGDKGDSADGAEHQEGEELNAFGKEMGESSPSAASDKGEEAKPGDEKPGDEKPAGEEAKPITAEETKSYKDALKLDEKIFGKDIGFDERYVEKLPAFFKKYGIDPAKANEMANEFAQMQRSVDEEIVQKRQKYNEWRAAEMQKMNEAFLEKYDKPGRQAIGRACDHFFKKGTPMYDLIRRSEIGVDPGFLEAMHFIGERLPADAAHGAAAGAGAGGGMSLSDSFMGR